MPTTELPIPDWVDCEAKPIRGLDLLGLRLPAQNIGVSLLSGITTISPTIRYLAVRCWMVRIFELTGLPASKTAWENFAESVESAIVLGNLLVNPAMTGLVGPTKAQDLVKSGVDPLPLESLVVQNAYATYAGPSDALGLTWTNQLSGLPILVAERGKPLADEVEHRLEGTRFRTIVGTTPNIRCLSREVLLELGTRLRIDELPEAEGRLLLEAIMPANPRRIQGNDERNRVASYTLLLELAKLCCHEPTDPDFFTLVARPGVGVSEDIQAVLDGWACYAIRDSLAVVHEAVLSAIVGELVAPRDGMAFVNGSTLLQTMLEKTDEINAPLRSLGLLTDDESYTDLTMQALAARVEHLTPLVESHGGIRRWQGPLTEPVLRQLARSGGAGALGLLPVAWLLARRRIEPEGKKGAEVAKKVSQRGRDRLGLEEIILPTLDQWCRENSGLPDVLFQLARRTVDQHLHISWTRFETDMKRDVALLIADGDRWYPRNKFKHGRLGSRLRQAVGWLRQLGLVDSGGITQAGIAALSRAHQILSQAPQEATA